MDARSVGIVVDESRFAKLDVSLVRLHGGFANQHITMAQTQQQRMECLRMQTEARRLAVENEWEQATMVYNRLGYYPAPLKEGDEIRDVDDRESEA